MISAPDGSGKNFCFKALYEKDIGYLPYQWGTTPATVVNTTDKRRYISSAGFGSQDSLPGRKYQRTIGADAVVGKPLDGFYPVFNHGHFYHDIGVNGRQFFPFFHDGLKLG